MEGRHADHRLRAGLDRAPGGEAGSGLKAQRQAIDGFVAQRGAALIARFTEVESGRNPDRPELGKALHLAKVTGATLVIAKLDRLSRNAAFLLTLRVETCQRPPRRVSMPRPFSSAAMARRLVAPPERMSATTGASSWACRMALRAMAALSAAAPRPARLSAAAPLGLPSFTPRLLATASAGLRRRHCHGEIVVAEHRGGEQALAHLVERGHQVR